LLRVYAASQARAHDGDTEHDDATGRMLDHYLHTAQSAALLLTSGRNPVTVPPPRAGVHAEQITRPAQARAWFDAEYQVLLACVVRAAESGFNIHAWQLPWMMCDYFDLRASWHEQASVQRTALAAATRLGDRRAEAVSRRLLANACSSLGDYDQAQAQFADTIRLYRLLGDQAGEARAHQTIGWISERQGRYPDALAHVEESLGLFRAAGHQQGQAEALNNIGWCRVLLGEYEPARAACRQALALSRELGYREVEAHIWDTLGYAEHHLGDLTEAAACYQRALGLHREFDDRYYEASTLTYLGDTNHTAGESGEARDAWKQALAILDDLRHPDATQVRAKLAASDDHGVGT
jgi:tetratricopeptide (TPR) repeat protein